MEEEGVAGARVADEPIDVRHDVAPRRLGAALAVVAQHADVGVAELVLEQILDADRVVAAARERCACARVVAPAPRARWLTRALRPLELDDAADEMTQHATIDARQAMCRVADFCTLAQPRVQTMASCRSHTKLAFQAYPIRSALRRRPSDPRCPWPPPPWWPWPPWCTCCCCCGTFCCGC